MNTRNIYPGIIFIVLALFFYYETFSFPNRTSSGDVGSAFWPRILIAIIILLSLLLILTSIKQKGNSVDSNNDSRTFSEKIKAIRKPLLGIIACFIFFFLFKIFGYFITVFILYMALALLMTKNINVKKTSIIIAQALLIILISFLLFDSFLKVDLPSGIFF